MDLSRNLCTWSDLVADIHEMPRGYSPRVEDGIGFYAPRWREKITKVFSDCAQKGIPYDEEMQIVTKSVKYVWVRTSGEAVRDRDGKIVKVRGAFQDITERKQAEEALRESEIKFRELFENISSGVAVYRPIDNGRDFEFVAVNKAAETIDQVCRDRIVGARLTEVFPGVEEFGLLDALRRVWKTGIAESLPDAEYNDERIKGWRTNYVYRLGTGEVVAVYDDVTSRKRAEMELVQSESRFRSVFEAANVGKSMTDLDGRVHVNKAFCDIVGYPPEELRHKKWQDLTPPEDIAKSEEALTPLISGEKDSTRFTKRYIRRDGALVWADVSVAMRRDQSGNPLHYITTVVDITERIHAREALARSEEQYRLIADNTLDVIWIMGMDFRFTYVNKAVTRHIGTTPQEWLNSHLADHCTKEEFARIRRIIADEAARGPKGDGVVFETEMPQTDGSWIAVETHANVLRGPDGRPERIQGVTRDITERRKSENRIKHLNLVLRAIRDVNQLITQEQDRRELLRRACRILTSTRGYRSAWICLCDASGRLHAVAESGIESHFEVLRDALEEGDAPACCRKALESDGVVVMRGTLRNCTACALPCTRRDTAALAAAFRHGGRKYGVLVVALPAGIAEDREEQSLFLELAGDVAYALHSMEMAAEHREAEAKIESLARFPAENPNPVMRIRAEGVLDYANESARTLFPDPLEAEPGRVLSAAWRNHVAHSLTSEEPLIRDLEAEGREFCAVFVPFAAHGYVNVYAMDVTQERRLNAQLLQAGKIESVGRLAGGVAHDFNNMLGAIMGNAEIALQYLAPTHKAFHRIQLITELTQRSAAITRQLLTFARKQVADPQLVILNNAVDEILKMLQRLLGEDITLEWRPDEALRPIKIDPAQVDQMLVNLCVNARDALLERAGEKRITIETAMESRDHGFCVRHPGWTPGEYVRLTVSDNGCGMSAETLSYVFEPFFTTKGVGKGTGLGLSTIHGIVKQNGGFINAHSVPGEGTTFIIHFPSADSTVKGDDERETTDIEIGHGEVVLFVEDESALLDSGRDMLKSLGYSVLTAGTPREALMVAEAGRSIDLLITDVIMPEMNGKELAAHLARTRPHLNVLFMSGYTADIVSRQGVLGNEFNFIEKPFSIKALSTKVRTVLNDSS